ncbi:hypothetical protein HEP84_00535 [Streptomyces sp. RLB1-33]|nr:hypothetical protein [Streptomyces sp. RLB1-33]QIY68027.1 hypothetical protein HEP84_00535 [Streptomyces sp. RLB1-33]
MSREASGRTTAGVHRHSSTVAGRKRSSEYRRLFNADRIGHRFSGVDSDRPGMGLARVDADQTCS